MFPSLSVSILYSIITLLLTMHVSNLAVSINQFLLRHTELILTISISSSVYFYDTSCSISLTTLFLLLWQTFWKCPILLHSVHTLPYTGHCLGWWIPHNIYMVAMVWSSAPVFLLYRLLLFWIFLFYQIVSFRSMYLTLLLGPSVHLPSWPMLTHLHSLYGHHFLLLPVPL